ncbi:MAG: FkbM family methyltransferase [Acidobacteriaceae bacterium]|nr:FkbM family methyltransferase [Acidobacteriaceae bacterium]
MTHRRTGLAPHSSDLSAFSDPVTELKRFCRGLWCARSRVSLLNAGVPCRLADGSRFLAHGDIIGWNVLTSSIRRRASYYTGEWRFVSRFLKPGMTVVDAGANQGIYTLLLSKCVGDAGRVFAFEPASPEFKKLKRNVQSNRCSNVVLESSALGSYDGVTEFHLCLYSRGSYSSRCVPAKDIEGAPRQIIEVPMITLDSYFSKHSVASCDFIKIDVEGGEKDLLKGAEKTLTQLRPLVLCELADIRTKPWGYFASELYRLLLDHGYAWYRSDGNGVLHPAAQKANYDPEWENLIAVPTEKRGAVIQ